MNLVLVRAFGNNLSRLIGKLYEYHIICHDIYYCKDYVEIKISINDYYKLKKYLKSYKFKIIRYYGLTNIKEFCIKYKVLLFSLLFSVISIFIFTNIITDVEVIHSDKNIRILVKEELEELGVKKYSFKKSYKNLNKIKKKILEKYPDNLEWIEVENKGMKYIVHIEERIINKEKKIYNYCNIIATKDAIITKIINYEGLSMVDVNKYVYKGDVLISGNINENFVCANGVVYGETWYTASVKIPLNYKEYKKTGKKRYNLKVKTDRYNYSIFRSRFKNINKKESLLFRLFNVSFYKETEYEVLVTSKRYSKKEALNQALKLSEEKVKVKLKDKERILDKKVLKKSVNNSTMEVEIFYSIEMVVSKGEKFE